MEQEYFVRPIEHAQGRENKPYKYSFLETERVLVGLNTLLQGQSQPLHDHPDQDKFYLVLSGTGLFTVGDATKMCGELELILAPAGIPHGVRNESDAMLTFLTVIAPFPRG